MASNDKSRFAPYLHLSSAPLCIGSHSTEPLLSVGVADKQLAFARLDGLQFNDAHKTEQTVLTRKLPSNCLSTTFQEETTRPLLFAGIDGQIHVFDIEHSSPVRQLRLPKIHDNTGVEVTRLPTTLYSYDAHSVLVGDDNGGIHLYDVRVGSEGGSSDAVAGALEQGDYISALLRVEKYGTCAVLGSSGDGTVCAYDIRRLPKPRVKLQYATDQFHDDILSMGIVDCAHGDTLIVAGTLCGMLNLYNLRFLDVDADAGAVAHVDRFAGHPECVNSIVSFGTPDVVVTASSDGYVRVVDVVSKTLLGVLEYQSEVMDAGSDRENTDTRKKDGVKAKAKKRRKRKNDKSRWPIEAMTQLHGVETPTLALICHDAYVRFCDASALQDDDNDEFNENDENTDAQEVPNLETEGTKIEEKNGSDMPTGSDNNRKARKGLSMPREAFLEQKEKKGKRRKNKSDNSDPQTTNEFFDDL